MVKHFLQKVINYSLDILFKYSVIIEYIFINCVDALLVEEKVNNIIHSAVSVKRTTMTPNDLNQIKVTLLPGEVYPDDQVHVIDIYNNIDGLYISREACCGTHIQNTSDVIDFCIVQYKCLAHECTLIALTGPLCMDAKINGEKLLNKSNNLEGLLNSINSNNITPTKVTRVFNINYINISNTFF